MLGALIAAVLALRFFGRRAIAERTSGHMRGMTGYAGALFVVTVAFTLFEQIDILLIGAIIGTTAAGVFEAPCASRRSQLWRHGRGDRASRRAWRAGGEGPNVEAFTRAMRYLMILQAALLAPLLAWSGPIVDLTLGSGYEESADVLRALAPFVFLSGIGTFMTVAVNYWARRAGVVPLAIAAVVINWSLDVDPAAVDRRGRRRDRDGHRLLPVALGHIWICQRPWTAGAADLSDFVRCLLAAGPATLALRRIGTESLSALEWIAGGTAAMATYVTGLLLSGEISRSELRSGLDQVAARLRRRSR